MQVEPRDILPPQFIERLERLLPPDQLENVIATFASRRPTTFRVNTIKSTKAEIAQELSKLDIIFEEVAWMSDAFVLPGIPFETLGKLMESEIYKEGKIYVQNLSSMIPPLLLDPEPNEKVLDIAAAPGSKTTQMAAMMQNTGEIVANDLSQIRIYKLNANLKGQGVSNTRTIRMPGQILWRKYPEYFDRSLVDVPCSLEGTMQCDNPKSYEQWSVHKIRFLSQRQKFLLRSAVTATKLGGTIVYSTCTLAPEENEEVISWILEKEAGSIELLPIELPGIETMDGVTQWGNGLPYDERVAMCKRILPSSLMEGFFVAKLRKIQSNLIS